MANNEPTAVIIHSYTHAHVGIHTHKIIAADAQVLLYINTAKLFT